MCVCARMYVFMCVCVCVCERERDIREKEDLQDTMLSFFFFFGSTGGQRSQGSPQDVNIREAQWPIGYGVGLRINGPRFESGRGRCG